MQLKIRGRAKNWYFSMKSLGVKKCQLICTVRGIPETPHNLSVIMDLLQLENIKYKVATDFKMINVLVGMSVSSLALSSTLLFIISVGRSMCP